MLSIVFVDTRVQNWEQLLAGLVPDVQVILLDSLRDGVNQIAQALTSVNNLDGIHIVSHGSEGMLYLGDTALISENLLSYTSELFTIGSALRDIGDIMLYGCDVAKGVAGQDFVEQFAIYTNADVAASTDSTGSAVLGGNWHLESQVGLIC